MLDAARVMRTRGLARATTKEIAKEAGYSEAALYKHFHDKADLFLAVLNERTPGTLGTVLARLGDKPLEESLEEVARAAIAFYRHSFPMAASLFAEPRLLTAYRDALRARGAGRQHVSLALARYLAAEQDRGGLHPDADSLASTLVHTLLCGLLPRP